MKLKNCKSDYHKPSSIHSISFLVRDRDALTHFYMPFATMVADWIIMLSFLSTFHSLSYLLILWIDLLRLAKESARRLRGLDSSNELWGQKVQD